MRNALKGITPTGAIWVIGLLDALAFVGGIALSFYKRVGFNASVSGSLFLVAAITFLGLLGLAQNMKQAIAGTFVIVYFAIMFTIVFAGIRDEGSELSKQILSNFTTLTGVVVGSYFAAAAVEKVSEDRAVDPTTRRGGDVQPLIQGTFDTDPAAEGKRNRPA